MICPPPLRIRVLVNCLDSFFATSTHLHLFDQNFSLVLDGFLFLTVSLSTYPRHSDQPRMSCRLILFFPKRNTLWVASHTHVVRLGHVPPFNRTSLLNSVFLQEPPSLRLGTDETHTSTFPPFLGYLDGSKVSVSCFPPLEAPCSYGPTFTLGLTIQDAEPSVSPHKEGFPLF